MNMNRPPEVRSPSPGERLRLFSCASSTRFSNSAYLHIIVAFTQNIRKISEELFPKTLIYYLHTLQMTALLESKIITYTVLSP